MGALSDAKKAARRCYDARRALPKCDAVHQQTLASVCKSARHSALAVTGSARHQLQVHAAAAAEEMCRLLVEATAGYLKWRDPPVESIVATAAKGVEEIFRLSKELDESQEADATLVARLLAAGCALFEKLAQCPAGDGWEIPVHGALLDLECVLRFACRADDAAAARAGRRLDGVRRRIYASGAAAGAAAAHLDAASRAIVRAAYRAPSARIASAAECAELRAAVLESCDAHDGARSALRRAQPPCLEARLADCAAAQLVVALGRCAPALQSAFRQAPHPLMLVAARAARLGEHALRDAIASELLDAKAAAKRAKQLDLAVRVASDACYAAFKAEHNYCVAQYAQQRAHEGDLLRTLAAVIWAPATTTTRLVLAESNGARDAAEEYAEWIGATFGATPPSLEVYTEAAFEKRWAAKAWAAPGYAAQQVARTGVAFYHHVNVNVYARRMRRAPPLEFRRAEAMDVVHEWALLWRGRAARPGAPHPDFEVQRTKIVPCMIDLMQRAAYMECLEQMAQVGVMLFIDTVAFHASVLLTI